VAVAVAVAAVAAVERVAVTRERAPCDCWGDRLWTRRLSWLEWSCAVAMVVIVVVAMLEVELLLCLRVSCGSGSASCLSRRVSCGASCCVACCSRLEAFSDSEESMHESSGVDAVVSTSTVLEEEVSGDAHDEVDDEEAFFGGKQYDDECNGETSSCASEGCSDGISPRSIEWNDSESQRVLSAGPSNSAVGFAASPTCCLLAVGMLLLIGGEGTGRVGVLVSSEYACRRALRSSETLLSSSWPCMRVSLSLSICFAKESVLTLLVYLPRCLDTGLFVCLFGSATTGSRMMLRWWAMGWWW